MTKEYKQPKEVEIEDVGLAQPMFLANMLGSIETVTSAPTGKPTKFIDQFKFYSTGGTYRLYVYDAKNDVWRYCTFT